MAGKRTYLTTEDFIKGVIVEPQDYEVPGLGWVQVRGVTTLEMQRINEKADGDQVRMMALAIRMGLVQPELNDEQVDALASGQAGIVTRIANRVMELSGMSTSEAMADAIEGEAGGSSSGGSEEPQT